MKTKNIENPFLKITKNDIFNLTSVIYLAIIVIYELFYCNYGFFVKIIPKYNFSIYRIIAYVGVYFLIYKFKDKFISSALESFKIKAKCYFVNIILIFCIGILVLVIRNVFVNQYLSIYTTISIIANLLIILFSIYISNDMIKNIIITALTFGAIFSITITFNNQLDEKRHFLASYSVALGELDLKNPSMDKSVAEIPRQSYVHNFIKYFSIKPTGYITKEHVEEIQDSPNNYLTVSYIASGIGIFISKTLGGSIADIYITGRIFNLLTYISIIVLTLKTLPYKKNILYTIFCMPMVIALSSVYSVDGTCIALIAFFIANCLKIHEKDNISFKELVILMVSFILAITAKSVGYAAIALIIFILPLKKIIKQYKKYIKYILAILGIILLIIIYGYITKINEEGDPWGQGVDNQAQFNYIINNPVSYGKILLNHTKKYLTNLGVLRYLNAPMFFKETCNKVFIAMLAWILFISITDSSKQLKAKTRLIFVFTYFVIFAMTSTAMYISFTKLKASYIAGFQTRYIFPILFLILSSISIKTLGLDYNKYKTMNLYLCCTSSIFLIASALDAIM